MQGTILQLVSYFLSLLWSESFSVVPWFHDLDSFEEYFVGISYSAECPSICSIFLTSILRLWVSGKTPTQLKDPSLHVMSGGSGCPHDFLLVMLSLSFE